MWLVIAIIGVALGVIIWATTRKGKLGHWARLAVFFLSGGFVFANVMTEAEDIANSAPVRGPRSKSQ